ncbi:MAG: 3-deoxy-D-manno-octulosonic acid transferase [Boseongicola sp.]
MSPLLRVYVAFSQISGPIWRLVLRSRLKKGKEIAARLPEKFGHYSRARPAGQVLWFHALSVGESLALVPLIERALSDLPAAHVVLTTSTATSVQALDRAGLPDRAVHVLLPIDTGSAVRRFLDYWRPDAAVFAELDFWPRLMVDTHRRGIPMVLINSRMLEKNYLSRRKLGGMMRDILGFFSAMLVQDDDSAARFIDLGADPARVSVAGILKSAARPLPADPNAVEKLGKSIGDRIVWLAAATHPDEEQTMVDAHRQVVENAPNALAIIAPRQPESADALESYAKDHFVHVARRSRDEVLNDRTQIYIADTIGEMGIWYRLAPVSFIGHSLELPGHEFRGKNPYEAAALDSVILHGPAFAGQLAAFNALSEAGGERQITDAKSLAEAVFALSTDSAERDRLSSAAHGVIDAQKDVLERTWAAIVKVLPSPAT